MKKSTLFLCLVFFVVIFFRIEACAESTGSQPGDFNIGQIMEQVEKQGPEAMLKGIYADGVRWRAVLGKIASAEPEWIRLAVILKPHADAGASEMLNYAVGEALAKSPESVFGQTNGVFAVENICDCPDIDDIRYSTYDKAVAEVNRRIEALEKMKSGDSDEGRDLCLKKLEESVLQLKRFFGVE